MSSAILKMRAADGIRLNIRGFTVDIRASFFVLAALSALFGFYRLLLTVFIFVTLHEFCHIMTAYIFGVRTSRIVVYPIGECAQADGIESINIAKRIAVLLAGPAFNALCAVLFRGTVTGGINAGLALFNILPVYPLDGGKILHYITAYFMGTLRSGRCMAAVSAVCSVLIVIMGMIQTVLFFGNVSMLAAGVYIFRLNRYKYINAAFGFYRTLIKKPKRRILSVRSIAVSSAADIKTVVYRLGWDYYLNIMIRSGGECVNISEDEFINYVVKYGIAGKMESVRGVCAN